jgi:hypothetical protein
MSDRPLPATPTEADRLACRRDVPTRYEDVAPPLVDNGWATVPLHPDTKIPSRKHWPDRIAWPLEILRSEVARELSWRGDADRRASACGIVIPPIIVAIDSDLLDPHHSATLWRIMLERLGQPAMVRVGASPKWMAFYRAQPGITSRRLPGLDVFSGSGQFAAFGIHHKTRLAYRWSERNPLNTRPEEL